MAPRPRPRPRPHNAPAAARHVHELYNTRRPHRALDRRTPLDAYTARPPVRPGNQIAPTHYRIRRDAVNSGNLTLRHNSRLHHIAVGRRHDGTAVLMLIADLDIRIISIGGQLIRELTLDPTRDYQPLGTPNRRDEPEQKESDVARQV